MDAAAAAALALIFLPACLFGFAEAGGFAAAGVPAAAAASRTWAAPAVPNLLRFGAANGAAAVSAASSSPRPAGSDDGASPTRTVTRDGSVITPKSRGSL